MALKLGVNEPFRAAVESAGQLTGIDSSALAAVIDAEAAKIGSGANKGMWDKNSFNSSSGAGGMTQFLESTWIGHAQGVGHLLNTRGKELGYVSASNKVVAGKKNDLLKLRFDPLFAIVSAAEYGADNLKILAHAGVLPANLTDDQRARYIYLAHHEGASGAKGFLNGTKLYTRSDLVRQVGANKADTYIAKHHGDASAAYRAWLNDYMDLKIVPSRWRDAVTAPPSAAVLSSVTAGANILLAPAVDVLPAGRAIVTTDGLNFRKTADGAIIRSLDLGDEVTVIGRIGDTRWYDVDIAGTKGVVSGAYLRQPLPPSREALFRKTIDEWLRFQKGHSSEEDEPYDTYVHDMWRAIGENYWGHSTYANGKDVPWSAAFISWAVRKAGKKYAAFQFAAAHSKFSNDAIRARVMEQENKPFWAYRATEARPEVGDIIHRNRGSGSYTYDYAENHSEFESHSDIVVEVRGEVARVIGGNTGPGQGSVYMHDYGLENGFLKPGQLVIAVLKNRSELVP